jgi:quercetin dioxygenase-like cupin family protein
MSLAKNPSTGKVVELLDLRTDLDLPTLEFLTSLQDPQNDFCVMRGTLPPGVSVPLHSHADTEAFVVISGELEALRQDNQGHSWIKAKANDYVHVPSNSRHAWRNVSGVPAVVLVITTRKLGQFFQEAGRPKTGTPLPVTPEDLERFAAISTRYGIWYGSREENALVGIHLSQ